jgi:cytochrome c oxidase assembly protein subunit 15
MTDIAEVARPVPRWLFAVAILAAVVALFLLVLGQLVTTLKAGMADPGWPTAPWHLVNNYKDEVNYLVEHSHRIAGFTLGGILGALTLGIWWLEPRKTAKWVGVVAVAVLLVGFGDFHRAVMNQTDPNRLDVPAVPVATMGAALLVLAAIGGAGLAGGVRGSGLRLFAVVVLVAVMTQGVLGGLRVRLNALHGPELAAVHGVFAQVVFCLIALLAVFCTRPHRTDLPAESRGAAGWLSLLLVVVLLGQLVLGVLVRHLPTPLAQRLHFLTAFAAVAVVVGLLRAGFGSPLTRVRVAPAGWLLGVLVAVQLVLGVEAWMGKFSDEARNGQPADSFLPETAIPTPYQVAIRTSHVLVGTGVLACAVVLAVGLRRRAGAPVGSLDGVHESREVVETPRPALAGVAASDSGESR